MKNEQYIINDTTQFINSARKLVFGSFGKNDTDEIEDYNTIIDSLSSEDEKELDNVLSFSESFNIFESLAKKQKNKKTDEIRYIIDEHIFAKILEALNSRLVSNTLSSLIKKGIVETAYDNELNDFVFWVKNNDTTQ